MSEHLLIGSIGDSRGAERLAAERVLESAAGRVRRGAGRPSRERPRPASLLARRGQGAGIELLEACRSLSRKPAGASSPFLSAAQSERLGK